jgi:PEP-CTERM motif
MNRSQSLMYVLGALLVVAPTLAFADTYSPCTSVTGVTLCATTSGLNSMDKTQINTWGFSGITVPTGKVIASASISFNQIYNWDTAVNRLDIDLLDSPTNKNTVALNGSVASKTVNSVSTDSPVSQWNDDFLHINTVTPSGLGDYRYSLTATNSAAYGMVAVGADHNGTDNTDHADDDNPHTGTIDQTHSFTNPTPVNYTYTLSAADLAVLTSYINNGGDFAFGFNSDCHYFDSGVTMQITFAPAAVPEPSSILLFGTVAILAAWRMRRVKRTQV